VNCRAQVSISTVILVLCIVITASILISLYLNALSNRLISARQASFVSKISTNVEAYSDLIYNKSSGYARLLLRIFNLGPRPVTISSVFILNCTSNNVLQSLEVPRQGEGILFRKVVVIKVQIKIPAIEGFKTEGFVNMSVLLNKLTVQSIEDSGYVTSEEYIAFLEPTGSLTLRFRNISIILNLTRSSSGSPMAVFTIFDQASGSIIARKAVTIRYGASHNFNITILAFKTNRLLFFIIPEYNVTVLGYLDGKEVVHASYLAVIGGAFPGAKGGVGCVPLATKDVVFTFNYVKVHYDSQTKVYYMKKVVEKYVKYVKVVYKWNSTVYPGRNITIVIKFKPTFKISPGMCYDLMIVSRSGAFWYVNYVDNRVEIVS